ncbi:MAG: hypothetical protein Q9160_005322 [Pyrenula sp. 1 TL-2023]
MDTTTLPAVDTTANAKDSVVNDRVATPGDAQTTPHRLKVATSFPTTPKPETMTMRYSRESFQKIEIGYVAKPTPVPSDWSDYFDNVVFPKLDKHVQRTIVTKYGVRDIIRLIRYRMFGRKRRDKVGLNATILIGCTDNKCAKYLKKSFSVNELAYLKHFDQPWKIYLEDIRYGAANQPGKDSSQHFDKDTASEPGLEIERTLNRKPVGGVRLKLTSHEHTLKESLASRYAVIGGVICLGAHRYGLTTGHLFAADSSLLESEGKTSLLEGNSSGSDEEESTKDLSSSSPASSDDEEPGLRRRQSTCKGFIPVDSSTPESLAYTFLDWEKTLGSKRTRSLFGRNADWAIIRLSEDSVFENSYQAADRNVFVATLAADSEMVQGSVYVLCTADAPLTGTLTAGKSYLQTMSGTLTALEIAMNSPLPYGYSGS